MLRVDGVTLIAGGHCFNMDGAGADGNATPRFAAYGATKRSLQQVCQTAGGGLTHCSTSEACRNIPRKEAGSGQIV